MDIAAELERCYRTRDVEGMRAAYADDVVLDAHVPGWRFQLEGPDKTIAWFTDTIAGLGDYRIPWSRVTTGPDVVVLEWEMRVGEGDQERLCQQVDVLHLAGGRVTEHVFWCTGIWDPATVARQRAEAPMVRR